MEACMHGARVSISSEREVERVTSRQRAWLR